MTKPFDPKKSYLSIKSHEGIIAFVGFNIRLAPEDAVKEGVLKIASNYKAYGGGSLTLTFIVDTSREKDLKQRLNQLFKEITEESLREKIGANFLKSCFPKKRLKAPGRGPLMDHPLFSLFSPRSPAASPSD